MVYCRYETVFIVLYELQRESQFLLDSHFVNIDLLSFAAESILQKLLTPSML